MARNHCMFQFLSLYFGLLGCGNSSHSSTTGSTKAQESNTLSQEQTQDKLSDRTATANDGSVIDNSMCLSCSAPAEAQYTFNHPTTIVPAGCAVTEFKVLQSGATAMVLYLGDCGQGPQIYLIKPTSVDPPQSKVVSESCVNGSQYAMTFAADINDTEMMLVYACEVQAGLWKMYAVAIRIDENILSDAVYLGSASNATVGIGTIGRYSLAWNAKTSSFGLVNRSSFMRIDRTGRQIGGSTSIMPAGSNSAVVSIFVDGSDWLVLHDERMNGSTSYCSKIDAFGLLLCRNNPIPLTNVTRLPNGQLSGVVDYQKIGLAGFDAQTCSSKPVLAASDQDSFPAIAHFGNSVPLKNGFAATVYQRSTGTLSVGVYTTGAAPQLLGEVSVADLPPILSARLIQFPDRQLSVLWTNGQGIFMSTTEQEIH